MDAENLIKGGEFLMTNLPPITWHPLAQHQFIDEIVEKDTVFLHHTASDPNPFGVEEYWESTKEAVSTAFLIGGPSKAATPKWKDGEIVQCFNSKKWGW